MQKYIKDGLVTYTSNYKKITDTDGQLLGCFNIKEGVEEIGPKACQYGNFSTVKFPDSLKLINCDAFFNSQLEYVEINKNISLSAHCFEGCDNLHEAIVESEYIPIYCFAECDCCHCNNDETECYVDFTLKNTVEIGNFAFNSSRIGKFDLPNTLKKIGEVVFYCAHFKNPVLFLPEGLEEIGSCAFSLTNLTDIYLPKSIKKVDNSILDDNIILHIHEESIENLGHAFCSNKNVKVLTLEELLQNYTFKEINNNKLSQKER